MSFIYGRIEGADKIIKQRIEPVVTLEQAKKQLNVDNDFTDDDTHIAFLIESATGAAEDYIGRDIALTHNTLKVYDFAGSEFAVRESPFVSVEKITILKDGQESEVPEDKYKVYVGHNQFKVEFDEALEADEMVVEFITGYSADSAPAQLVNAILVKLASLYDVERSNYSFGVAFKDTEAFEKLLSGHVNTVW